MAVSPDTLAPVQRVGPGPWILWLVQPIAGPNKVIGGGKIVRGVRNDAAPSIVTPARFQRTHQAQLKGIAAMSFQHADTAEIPRVEGARRRHDSGKGDRYGLVKREPPMPAIEFRNGRAVKECQAVKISERIGDFVVMSVDLANPVHRLDLETFICRTGDIGVAG